MQSNILKTAIGNSVHPAPMQSYAQLMGYYVQRAAYFIECCQLKAERDKYIVKPEEVVRDEQGYYHHSKLPDVDWVEGDPECWVKWEEWLDRTHLRIEHTLMEDSDDPDGAIENYYDTLDGTFAFWQPKHHNPKAFILTIADDEDGVYCMWGIPVHQK